MGKISNSITRFAGNAIRFQQTNKSIYIFCSMILISYVIQQILFGLGFIDKMAGAIHGTADMWQGYLFSALQLIGSLAIVVNLTLIARQKRSFIWFSWIGNTALLIYSISIGIWFEFLRRLLFLLFYQLQHYRWKRQQEGGGKNTEASLKIHAANLMEWIVFIVLIGAVVGGLGFGFSQIDTEHILHNPSPWLDSAQFILAILGVLLGVMKYRESSLFYAISNLLIVIMYATLGEWTSMVSSSIFLAITITSTFNWYGKARIFGSKFQVMPNH